MSPRESVIVELDTYRKKEEDPEPKPQTEDIITEIAHHLLMALRALKTLTH